jgi:hypothetical protein
MNRAKSAKPLQTQMARRRHGLILDVEALLVMWTNEQTNGISKSSNEFREGIFFA